MEDEEEKQDLLMNHNQRIEELPAIKE